MADTVADDARARWRRRAASLLGALSVGAWIATAVLTHLAGGASAPVLLFDRVAEPVFAVVGAAIIRRRPGHAVGWVMIGAGVAFSLESLGAAWADASLAGVAVPGAVWAAWGASWLFSPAWLFAFVWLPMLFPNGTVLGPRWRPLVWLGVVCTLQVVPAALVPELQYDDVRTFGPNPLGVGTPDGLMEALVDGMAVLVVPLWIAIIAQLVVRHRRADPVQRAQLRWFLWSITLVVGMVLLSVSPRIAAVLNAGPFGLMVAAVPLSVGIAVTRYRLYDIDRLVSRTVSYAVVTAVLLGLYAVGVLAIGAVVRPLASGDDLAVAASTLVVAAAFRPVLRRVRRVVERRFDRRHHDAARVLEEFTSRLREGGVELEGIRSDLLRTTRDTVHPTVVHLWLPRVSA